MKVCCITLVGLALIASIEAWGPGSIACCPPGEPPVCPVQPCDDFNNLFPHPNDCGFFIHCDAGRQPICKQCAPGLHFNAKLGVCDWPDKAGCDPNYNTTPKPCDPTPTPTTACTTTKPCSTTVHSTPPPSEC